MKMKVKILVLTAPMAASFYWTAARADVPATTTANLRALQGRIETDAGGTVTAQDAVTLGIGPAQTAPYCFEAQVQLAQRGKVPGNWRLVLADPKDPKAAVAAAILNRDDEGHVLSFQLQARNAQGRLVNVENAVTLKYWPDEKPAKPNWMSGIRPPSCRRPPPGKNSKRRVSRSVFGAAAGAPWRSTWTATPSACGSTAAMSARSRHPRPGTVRRHSCWARATRSATPRLPPRTLQRMVPIDLQPQVNDRFDAPFKQRRLEVGGVPFRLPEGPQNQLSLRDAQWIEWKTGLTAYWSAYDGGAQDALRRPHAHAADSLGRLRRRPSPGGRR